MRRQSFTHSGFFVLRTPLLPFDDLVGIGERVAGVAVDRVNGVAVRGPAIAPRVGDVAEACAAVAQRVTGVAAERSEVTRRVTDVAAERAGIVQRLRTLVRRGDVREALFVASPSLDDALTVWLETPDAPRAEGVVEALYRYVARMAGRATPFGLFSGCSLGTSGGADTCFRLGPHAGYRRATRFDMLYLLGLSDELASAYAEEVHLRPTSGLLRTGERLHFACATTGEGARDRTYHLVAAERSALVDAALERAASGATAGEIAASLRNADVSAEDADALVQSMVDAQLLVSELTPALTGEPALDGLLAELDRVGPSAGRARRVLADARSDLAALDAGGIGQPTSAYRDLAERLGEVSSVRPALTNLIQVDLAKPAPSLALGDACLRVIEEAIALVVRVGASADYGAMAGFRAAFAERFGDRAVPLAHALDEEVGIGFGVPASDPSPLLDGLGLPQAPAEQAKTFGAREEHLLRGILETTGRGLRTWTLEPEDIARLTTGDLERLPDAFELAGSLFASSASALTRGDVTVLVDAVSGPSGARTLGRFCHADPAMLEAVVRHLRQEEALRPDAVFAEVVHHPDGRPGNVLARPVLRAYEIPYLGRSGAPPERQIAIDDLHLRLEGPRMVLFSPRLGREVVPRTTTAHRYDLSPLALYRFLGALEDTRGFMWRWGSLANAPSLPRVACGRAILALARWNLSRLDLADLAERDPVALFDGAQRLRARLGLPRWVSLADDDHLLPIDLDNVVAVSSLSSLVRHRERARLVEMLPTPDELVAEGPEGRYVAELIIPFVKTRPPTPPATEVRRADSVPSRRRTFPPGSEWLYASIYAGKATVDDVLLNVVAPLVEELSPERWFFVRYADPGWHLRLRLHGASDVLASAALPRLSALVAPYLADGRVSRLQLDTYEREVERYGGPDGIELAERIFEADSAAALAILALCGGGADGDARWRLALRGMHLLLDDLGFDHAAAGAVVERMRGSFAREHHVDAAARGRIGVRYRVERSAVEALVTLPVGANHELDPAFAVLAERSRRIAPLARELAARARTGSLTAPLSEIASSLLHMHVNRMLRSDHREHETVLHDFLARAYQTSLARARRVADA